MEYRLGEALQTAAVPILEAMDNNDNHNHYNGNNSSNRSNSNDNDSDNDNHSINNDDNKKFEVHTGHP